MRSEIIEKLKQPFCPALLNGKELEIALSLGGEYEKLNDDGVWERKGWCFTRSVEETFRLDPAYRETMTDAEIEAAWREGRSWDEATPEMQEWLTIKNSSNTPCIQWKEDRSVPWRSNVGYGWCLGKDNCYRYCPPETPEYVDYEIYKSLAGELKYACQDNGYVREFFVREIPESKLGGYIFEDGTIRKDAPNAFQNKETGEIVAWIREDDRLRYSDILAEKVRVYR